MKRLLLILFLTASASADTRRPALKASSSRLLTKGVKRSSNTALITTTSDGLVATTSLAAAAPAAPKMPSFYWAVLHNWCAPQDTWTLLLLAHPSRRRRIPLAAEASLAADASPLRRTRRLYFLSLGFNLINVQNLVREIVDGAATGKPSATAIALSGRVESVDKILTFLGVGFLAALSDIRGRKPLMAWSSLGFAVTNLIQARTSSSIARLYLADLIDGCSSCMTPVCQAYVTDCSTPAKRAANLGIFQGLSIGCAFILAFPIGGVLGAKHGPRVPLYIAACLQLLNALIIIFITPE